MPSPLEKFQALLRELFQFEHADLDFGVYRIMNLRRGRMEKWINKELPARAREILRSGGQTADEHLEAELARLKIALLGVDEKGVDADGNIVNEVLKGLPAGKEYLSIKTQLDRAPARSAAGMEPLVYNHLYDFFSRYYDTGDFIPKRRRSFAPDGRDTYAVPWDGEEVVLHWANKDQYYIKTGERFTHYRWQSEVGGQAFTVEFRLTDADLPAHNNKETRKKFNLLVTDKVEWEADKATLILPFHYRALTGEEEAQFAGKQDAKLRESIVRQTVETVCALPVVAAVPNLAAALLRPKRDATGQEKLDRESRPVALLPHHLTRWAIKNESDFFIHKDLRRFLRGELDYFLKSVVLNLDNLLAAGEPRAEPNFRLLDAVKRLGMEIVDFVSQLEDFQKAMFEKKKFVLETSWCLTLDRIPAGVKEEVYVAILANDRQWEEWEKLYRISQWPADIASVPIRTGPFLDALPFLMMDTALGYAAPLIEAILCGVRDLDAYTDGLIIHSENFQALGLLSGSFHQAVNCIYIDPPYNTDGSPIAYKNSYKSSSWTTLIDSRLRACKNLLAPDGVLVAAIDDEQQRELSFVLSSVFAGRLLGTVCVRSNPSGRPTQTGYAVSHEYLLFAGNGEKSRIGRMPPTEAQRARFTESDEEGPFEWRNLRREGSDSNRSDRRTMYYPIYITVDMIRIPKMRWQESSEEWIVEEEPLIGEKAVYPDNEQGEQKRWRWEHPTVTRDVRKLKVREDRSGRDYIYYKRRPHEEGVVSASSWFDAKYSATEHGTALLKSLFGNTPFDYPKSIHAVVDSIYLGGGARRDAVIVDFFGGSGTSGQAVLNLNRNDRGSRKYVLAEMGQHFDTAVKPRLQKAVFSENWKNGAPERQANREEPDNPYNGISHCLKILRLESYEDALDNIEFDTVVAPGEELGLDFKRDYELRYALDWESRECPTRLTVDRLEAPFDYTLTLRRESGTVTVKPDLPETFAYLIGLHTRRRFRTERAGVVYLIYTGTLHEDGTEAAVLWRTCQGWTEEQLQTEKNWWQAEGGTLAPGATRIYVNGASAIARHVSLDAEFKTRMHATSL